MPLRLYDTLTRQKRDFSPIDPANVRMYVCGPTVYDHAHIGNARPVIVFDLLYRLLRHVYGEKHVTYVRNITDVDDKINARALRDFGDEIAKGRLSLNQAIRKVTETTYTQFQEDVAALGCLEPTHQPRATDFVVPRSDGKADMVTMIAELISRGHAYAAGGEVLFDVSSMQDYGELSGRKLDEQKAGARVAVDAHKKHPGDFVLWKQSSAEEPGWDSPWGRGRPGWHIECSAMAAAYLGDVFDIHGGGLDLIFPHHENEIAQSRCAHGTDVMANTWMHNGFLQVEGEKMSKSTGNFVTIRELLEERFGAAVRLQMLATHYRQPIDWISRRSDDVELELSEWAFAIESSQDQAEIWTYKYKNAPPSPSTELIEVLCDDLNTPNAITVLRNSVKKAREKKPGAGFQLFQDCVFLGLLSSETLGLHRSGVVSVGSRYIASGQDQLVRSIRIGVANNMPTLKEGAERDLALKKIGVTYANDGGVTLVPLEDVAPIDGQIDALVEARTVARARKDFAESDRIRDELAAMGVVLKDGKDADGKPITTWEIAR